MKQITNQSILTNLTDYDSYLNAYIQIDQTAQSVSWFKADLLADMTSKLGEESLRELSKELGENYATLVSYVRVSRAFPVEKRSEKASFSLHFQASFADRLNSENKTFDGEARFDYLDRAVDENLSTRSLARLIHGEKEEVGEEPSEASIIGEKAMRRLHTVRKMAEDGNGQSLSLLIKINELLESYA